MPEPTKKQKQKTVPRNGPQVLNNYPCHLPTHQQVCCSMHILYWSWRKNPRLLTRLLRTNSWRSYHRRNDSTCCMNNEEKNEPPDSPSSDGECAIYNKSILIVQWLGRKMNDLHANTGVQLKLLDAKMTLLGTKVDKIQRDVSCMY